MYLQQEVEEAADVPAHLGVPGARRHPARPLLRLYWSVHAKFMELSKEQKLKCHRSESGRNFAKTKDTSLQKMPKCRLQQSGSVLYGIGKVPQFILCAN